MKTIIEIYDKDEQTNLLNFDLFEVIKNFEPFLNNYNVWTLLDFEATGKTNFKKEIYEISEKVNDSNFGIIINFSQLKELASKIYQTIDMTIVAGNKSNSLYPPYVDEKLVKESDFFLQCCDSSYWRVYTIDDSLLQFIKQHYKEKQVIEIY